MHTNPMRRMGLCSGLSDATKNDGVGGRAVMMAGDGREALGMDMMALGLFVWDGHTGCLRTVVAVGMDVVVRRMGKRLVIRRRIIHCHKRLV